MGKPRSRKESAVWRDVTDLLQTLNWKVVARYGEGCRNVIREGHSTKTGQSTIVEQETFTSRNKHINKGFNVNICRIL